MTFNAKFWEHLFIIICIQGLGTSSLGVKVPVVATREDVDFTDDLLDPTSQAFADMEQRFCAEVTEASIVKLKYMANIIQLVVVHT